MGAGHGQEVFGLSSTWQPRVRCEAGTGHLSYKNRACVLLGMVSFSS